MKSSCVITFEGLNINRLLNILCQKNIVIYKVERQGKICVLQCAATYSGQVVALLREKCYNIKNIRYTGWSAVTGFVKKRYVLPIILVLCILTLQIASQFCFKIEVKGDFDEQSVCSALSTAGITVGSRLSDIDVDAAENSVANSLDAMYAVINRKGSVVYVNVVAKKQIDEPIDMHSRRDIVAKCAGVVSSVLCEQGTAKVKVGDSVNAGDVLIEGSRIFNDGQRSDVYALGKVVVKQSATGFAEYDGKRTVFVETGEQFFSTGVVLFGREYGKICPFENYSVVKNSVSLYPLNLQLIRNCYKETRQVTVSANLDECLDELKNKALESAKSNCNFQITEISYEVRENGVNVVLYGEYEHY